MSIATDEADAQIRAEAVLSAFHYDDYEGEDDQDPRLRLGDYVYAFCELPTNMEEVGFHAHIVNFSDDYYLPQPAVAYMRPKKLNVNNIEKEVFATITEKRANRLNEEN